MLIKEQEKVFEHLMDKTAAWQRQREASKTAVNNVNAASLALNNEITKAAPSSSATPNQGNGHQSSTSSAPVSPKRLPPMGFFPSPSRKDGRDRYGSRSPQRLHHGT
jgi:hypothetical protein